MLRGFWQILPVFLYKRLARRYCEGIELGGIIYVTGAKDVLVRLQPSPNRGRENE